MRLTAQIIRENAARLSKLSDDFAAAWAEVGPSVTISPKRIKNLRASSALAAAQSASWSDSAILRGYGFTLK